MSTRNGQADAEHTNSLRDELFSHALDVGSDCGLKPAAVDIRWLPASNESNVDDVTIIAFNIAKTLAGTQ